MTKLQKVQGKKAIRSLLLFTPVFLALIALSSVWMFTDHNSYIQEEIVDTILLKKKYTQTTVPILDPLQEEEDHHHHHINRTKEPLKIFSLPPTPPNFPGYSILEDGIENSTLLTLVNENEIDEDTVWYFHIVALMCNHHLIPALKNGTFSHLPPPSKFFLLDLNR